MKKLFLLKSMLLLCALIVGSGSSWADEGDVLAQLSSTAGNGYQNRTTKTDSYSVSWVLSGSSSGVWGSNSNQKANIKPTAADLPVVKGVTSNATTSTQYHYFYYTTTAVSNVGSVEFYFSDQYDTSTSCNVYLVMGDAVSASGGDAYTQVELASTSTTAQGASISTNGTYTFTFAATQTSAKYYGLVIKVANGAYKRFSSASLTLKEGVTAVDVTSITLNKSTLQLAVGENETLAVTSVLPDNATDKTVTWSSSNSSIASVNSSTGQVSAVAVGGPVTITATANDGSGVTATCAVTVIAARVDVTGVTLNKNTTSLYVGGTETLTATVSPNDATNKNVVWSSSNTSVASVDADGVVTANAVGSATITAASEEDEDIKATCTVTVNPVAVTGVSLNKTSTTITCGNTETLTATVAPANATNKNVTWTSSNADVASVDVSGKVTANAVGTATITVTTVDQGETATCDVTVTANTAKPELSETIFEETFNSCESTGGNDDSWSSSIATGDFNTDNTGWSNENGSGADKCVKLGTSNKQGSATTPALGEAGTLTLSFRAGAWSGDKTEGGLVLSIDAGTGTLSKTTFDLSNAAWDSYEVTITGASTETKIKFSAAQASKNRFFLDDVVVTKTATTVDVTLNGNGFASYCSPFALDLTPTDDYAAYAVAAAGDNALTFTRIQGKVAANTPMILYNSAKASQTVSLPIIEDDDDDINDVSGNELIGTLSPTYVTATSGKTNFGLKGAQFVKFNVGTVKANKAYLSVDDSKISADAHELNIIFDEGQTTGISEVKGQAPALNGGIYNLNGQLVAQPTKGLYIVNGKKVAIK